MIPLTVNPTYTEWRTLPEGGTTMKKITWLLVAVVTLAGMIAFTAPASPHADDSAAPIFVGLQRPRSRQTEQYWCRFGQRCGDQGLPRRDASIPGRHDRCRSALRSRPVGGKQQGLWPSPIFRPWLPHEHSVYGQRLHQVRATGGWGFATFIDGKPAAAASMKSCFPCHNQVKASDLVFTHYAP